MLTQGSYFPSAPSRLYTEQSTEYGFKIFVRAPSGEVAISHYEAVVTGAGVRKTCEILSSSCTIKGLIPMTKYTIAAQACSQYGCGRQIEGTAWTLPLRMSIGINIAVVHSHCT